MEGRRVSHRGQKYNPLFVLFLCMIVAVIVMLIISITLGTKLGAATKKLKTAETQVEELKQTVAQLEDDLDAARASVSPAPAETLPDPTVSDPVTSDTPSVTPPAASSWLDLSGHNEIKVKPTQLLSGYSTYYATANVNVRSGPGTNYDRIASASYGTKVDVAARENGWSFVRIGSNYGWISSDYLSATQPQQQTPAAPTPPPAEASAGSLRRP